MPTSPSSTTHGDVLDARLTVPSHVAHRSFVEETVVLNLQTGRYHALNRTAGEVLDAVERGLTPRRAAEQLATDYAIPADQALRDVELLSRRLLDRDLLRRV